VVRLEKNTFIRQQDINVSLAGIKERTKAPKIRLLYIWSREVVLNVSDVDMTDVPQHSNSIIEILPRKTLHGVEDGVWKG
jgi:hypothetical protein